MVELWVVDVNGNINICMVQVVLGEFVVLDCIVLVDVIVDCIDLLLAFDVENFVVFEQLFGMVIVNDNCGVIIMELIFIVNMNCNIGMIFCWFIVIDGFGNVSIGDCQQLIIVEQVYNYEI